jgi:isovaleryl-CoA dehydrogenase
MGFLGVTIGEEYGGLGLDPLTEGLVVEQISRFSPAVGLSMVAHTNLCLGNIH